MNRLLTLFFAIAFIATIVIFFVLVRKEDKEIHENPGLTTATIIGDRYKNKGELQYTYEVDGIVYKDIDYRTFYQTKFEKFKGKKFTVAYSKKHPNYSILLLYPSDYEQFYLPFPDSLSWILNCK